MMLNKSFPQFIKFKAQCQQIVLRRYLGVKKKFYKIASVNLNDNQLYEIKLDNRKLKTPTGKPFEIRNENLAQMIAQEWNSQQDTIKRTEMHLTSLVNTQLDNPLNLDKQKFIESLVEHLESDTLSYRVCEPEALATYLKERWDPLILDFEQTFNCRLPTTESVFSEQIPKETKEKIKNYLNSFELSSLYGLQFVLDNLKSIVLTLALINKKITVEEAVKLSRLEQEYQIKHWGNVEWAHDLDLMLTRSRVSSGLIFFLLNNECHRQFDNQKMNKQN